MPKGVGYPAGSVERVRAGNDAIKAEQSKFKSEIGRGLGAIISKGREKLKKKKKKKPATIGFRNRGLRDVAGA